MVKLQTRKFLVKLKAWLLSENDSSLLWDNFSSKKYSLNSSAINNSIQDFDFITITRYDHINPLHMEVIKFDWILVACIHHYSNFTNKTKLSITLLHDFLTLHHYILLNSEYSESFKFTTPYSVQYNYIVSIHILVYYSVSYKIWT